MPAGADDVGVEQFSTRLSYFRQQGRGPQSQADPDASHRGREEAWIIQPILGLRVRQSEDVVHDLTLAVDVVSAASVDALDAISSASKENEAATLNLQTSVSDGPSTYQLRAVGHTEENYWSVGAGVALAESIADDNATLQLSLDAGFDSFDPIQPNGRDPGNAKRGLVALGVGATQLLSPTTLVSAGYTFTAQFGRLETPWNSLPRPTLNRLGDRFPETRSRHAMAVGLRQAIVESRTFVQLGYRFYVDSYEVLAHSPEAVLTQYLGDVWVRGRYRFHSQSAPWFWTDTTPSDLRPWTPRTADSDLEALHVHEAGLSVRWFYDAAGALTASGSYVELGYLAYLRSNSLSMHVASMEWGQAF